jgi:uncharacterized membrane protein
MTEHAGRTPARLDGLRYGADFIVILALSAWMGLLLWAGESGLGGWALAAFRLALGLGYVFFVPGYALQALFFPRRDDLSGMERFGFSGGLSVAWLAVVAIGLNYLPWGITLWPVAAALALSGLLMSAGAWARRLRLPAQDRFLPELPRGLRPWWGSLAPAGRRTYLGMLATLGVALISAAAIIFLPRPDEQFTEFYLLGSTGLTESFPREAVLGEVLTVTVGIHNLEGRAETYRLVVRDGVGTLLESAPVTLNQAAELQQEIRFTPQETGDDVRVEFLLFRAGQSEPYRRLLLRIKVKSGS